MLDGHKYTNNSNHKYMNGHKYMKWGSKRIWRDSKVDVAFRNRSF